MPRCTHSTVPVPVDAILPDGAIVPGGLVWDASCDEDGCRVDLLMDRPLIDALDDWAEHRAAWEDVRAHTTTERFAQFEPYDYLLTTDI